MSTHQSSNPTSVREKKVTPIAGRREALRRTDRSNAFMQELRLRIANLLQTTLDDAEIFRYFYQEIQSAVAVDGLTYRHSIAAVQLREGRRGQHRATYRLSTQDSYLGDIEFSRRQRFTEQELAKLESLLDLFVYPIRNALRYQDALRSALTDPLTGAGNRLALGNAMKREIELCRRYDRTMSILMVDIDCFKNINDLYGHNVGDQVLIKVAEVIRNSLRDADSVYRMGGEEFLTLMSATPHSEACMIANRLRQNLQNHTETSESTPGVTASIGVCEFHPEMSMDDFVNAADKAMYRAKKQGRNQVCAAPWQADAQPAN